MKNRDMQGGQAAISAACPLNFSGKLTQAVQLERDNVRNRCSGSLRERDSLHRQQILAEAAQHHGQLRPADPVGGTQAAVVVAGEQSVGYGPA